MPLCSSRRLPRTVSLLAAIVLLCATHCDSRLNAVSDATLKIKENGYPLETYSYLTADKYLLGMERIPYSKHAGRGSIGKPVLLVHGLYISSAVYTVHNSSLSFVLSDAGFDVWLFNARGSGLSRTLNIYENPRSSPDMNKISWNFSFQEIGVYDLTAAIDFVLKETGHRKLDLLGYSMGGSITLVGLSDRPEYNLKINKLVLLVPASRFKSPGPGALVNIIRAQSILTSMTLKKFNFWPPITDPDTAFQLVRRWCANENNFIFCKWFLIMIEGHDVPMKKNSVVDLMAIFPQPMSTKTSIHLLQSITSGKFRHFDYGPSKNMLRYNRTIPPDYDLSKVTAPTYMFYSKDDTIVGPEDARWLLTQLPNVKDVNYIDKITCGHISFIIHPKVKEVVFSQVANKLLDVSK